MFTARVIARLGTTCVVSLAGLVAMGAPAFANPVTCGQTISTPGLFQLSANCVGSINITAVNVTLKLQGFTISGPGTGIGIHATGANKLRILGPGTVSGGFTWGIRVDNSDNTTVQGVTATGNGGGIFFDNGSDKGYVIANTLNNTVWDILLGYDGTATGNQVVQNVMNGNPSISQILLYPGGDLNTIAYNTAIGTGPNGIRLETGALGNQISGNTAGNATTEHSAFDYYDGNAGCGTNRWRANKGGTANPAAFSNQPCIG